MLVTRQSVADGVTLLTLNRPDKLNALNADLIESLSDAIRDLRFDRSCRVVILTGAGRGFSAGLDLGGYGHVSGQPTTEEAQVGRVHAGYAMQAHISGVVAALRELPQPVIAAVNGPAAGGGLALALCSDIRIASGAARFNVAFVRIGVSGCDLGVSWMLPRLIGASRSWELMLTGRIIDAAEADRIGLLLKVVPPEGLLDAAIETAMQIAANSPWAIRMTKEVMWSQLEIGSLRAGIDLENRTQILSGFTQDQREAMQAFLEDRPPAFADR